jgi:uncharacterized membrane protein YjdF
MADSAGARDCCRCLQATAGRRNPPRSEAHRVHPDWTGSPQHFVAGLVLAFGVTAILMRRFPVPLLVSAGLAIAITMGAEAVVELIEYPLLYSDHFHTTAYFDTIADIADTLAGALVGGASAIVLLPRRSSR